LINLIIELTKAETLDYPNQKNRVPTGTTVSVWEQNKIIRNKRNIQEEQLRHKTPVGFDLLRESFHAFQWLVILIKQTTTQIN
jgi:hypothetical protein